MAAYLYILRCRDDSYYVGTTRGSLEVRVAEHNAARYGGYTMRRRPVAFVYHQEFDRIEDAIAAERQVKGWRREKKEALIRGDFAALRKLASRARDRLAAQTSAPSTVETHPSRRNPSGCSSGWRLSPT